MKKILLGILGFAVWNAYSQIEIVLPNSTENIAGTTLTYNISTSEVPVDDEYAYWENAKFYVKNVSSSNVQCRVFRKIVAAPSDWKDNLCWPPTCYAYNYLQGNAGLTPSLGAPNIISNSYNTDIGGPAEIKPQFYPKTPGSSATYRYIVVDASNGHQYDSVTVVVNYLNDLSVPTIQKTVEMTLSPNPANDLVTIYAEGVNDAKIRIVDVLGNVVYSGDFNQSKKLNLAEYKNGVYFITIQSATSKALTKKLVIKH